MKHLRSKKTILIILCFIIHRAESQSISQLKGVWKGSLKDSVAAFDYTLRIEKVFGNKFFGTSISSNQSFYCETRVFGSVKGGKITLYEAEIAKTNYKNKAVLCLLALNVSMSNGIITGKFRPITNSANCLPGSVKLLFSEPIAEKDKKEGVVDQESVKRVERLSGETVTGSTAKANYEGISQPKNIILAQRETDLPVFYNSRSLALIREIHIEADEAEIDVYDNGIVDGDSITLIDNHVPVFQKAGLSTKALKYSINNKQTEVHSIAFFADNLGSIAPNTGLMVITANRKRWEINFSSDFSNTSFVKIILNKKQ